jgi:uncharacterized protein (DUF58 family)
MTGRPSGSARPRPGCRWVWRPTPRGLVTAAAGLIETYIGIGGGYTVAAFVGLLLLAAGLADLAPLLAEAARWRRGLGLRRTVLPNPTAVGETVMVRYDVAAARPPAAALLDAVPAGLNADLNGPSAGAPGARRPPARRPAARRTDRPTPLRAVRRGWVEFGPVRLRRFGPLGLGRLDWAVDRPTALMVWPAWAACGWPGGRGGGLDAAGPAGPPVASADDTGLRDYRPGDEWRRVHWRATARRRRLMTRSEEPAQLPLAVVRAAVEPEAAAADVELAVSLAASALVALAAAGYRLRLVTDTAPSSGTSKHGAPGHGAPRRDTPGHGAPDYGALDGDSVESAPEALDRLALFDAGRGGGLGQVFDPPLEPGAGRPGAAALTVVVAAVAGRPASQPAGPLALPQPVGPSLAVVVGPQPLGPPDPSGGWLAPLGRAGWETVAGPSGTALAAGATAVGDGLGRVVRGRP